MSKAKAVMSWSSGKDSAFALAAARASGEFDIVGLVSSYNEVFERIAVHGTRQNIARAQANALNLPLIDVPLPHPCSNEIYEARMTQTVLQLKEQGITDWIFGDLFLEDVRAYRENLYNPHGITLHLPLWGRDTAELVDDLELRVVFRHPAGHSVESEPVLRCKTEVETYKSEQEVEPPEMFIHQSPRHLWVPVVDRRKDHKHRASIDDVVEVSNNKVGVVNMYIERNLRQCHTRDAPEHEIDDETAGEEHSTVEADLPPPEGGEPVEKFDACGNGNEGCCNREEQTHPGRSAAGEHVMGPDHQPKHHDCHDRIHHCGVAEQRFTAMDRKDFTHQSKCW